MTNERAVQLPRNAWINRVREEALRMRRPEVSKAFHIGMVIASYADPDGGGAFPSCATIAAIAGCTEETVTRCVKLLIAVGLLERKRRPNRSAVYQLLIPSVKPDWKTHMPLYTDTRQARRKQKLKEQEIAELLRDETRNPFRDETRNPFPTGVPEPVPAGGSKEPGHRSGTGADTVLERVPEPVPAGGDQYTSTSGRDPHPDHDMAEPSPKPQVRAGTHSESDSSPEQPAVARCTACEGPMVPRPGRTVHAHCTPAHGDAA